MRNKLWLIQNKDPKGWDVNHAHVICAPDEAMARELASKARRGEGSALWLDPGRSTCEILKPTRETKIILTEGQDG